MKTTKLISIASMLKSTAVVVLMTIGGVSAMWGATATLKVWDLGTSAYVTWGTVSTGDKMPSAPASSVLAWAPGEQSQLATGTTFPANSGASNTSTYKGSYIYPNQAYAGSDGATYYAVFQDYDAVNDDGKYYYTTKPKAQFCHNSITSFSPTSKEIAYSASGTSFTITASKAAGTGDFIWVSGNNDIATVEGTATSATVTIHRAGETYISYYVEANGSYCESEMRCELTVTSIAPTVTWGEGTVAVTGETTARFSGGQVSNDGGTSIVEYGYVYGTGSSPSIDNSKASWTSAIALNTEYGYKDITSLTSGTTYYVRAYAKNGDGQVGYSSSLSFTTRAYTGALAWCGFDVDYYVKGSLEHTAYANPVNEYDVPAYLPEGTCASGKLFQGWTGSAVTSLQQTLPTIVTEDGSIDDVDEDTDLYAVYAVRNGRYFADSFEAYTLPSSVSGVDAAIKSGTLESLWRVDYGKVQNVGSTMASENKFTQNTKVIAIAPPSTSVPAKLQTKNAIKNLQGIKLKVAANAASFLSFSILYSTNGTTWSPLKVAGSGINAENIAILTKACVSVEAYIPSTPDEAYLKIIATESNTDKILYVDDVEFLFTEDAYWYSDYSTTCDKPSSATLSMTDGGSITSVESNSLPHVYTIDSVNAENNTVPTKAGYLFDHYTIQGLNYYRGDSYMMGHDVTATTAWIGIPPTLSGTDIYVTSGKDIATTSSMSITATGDFHTSGTLTIEDATGDQGGTFSAVITDATVSTTLNATIKVTYTPTKANVTETATMTATINGQTANFTVHGRSLPSSFVIVANTGGSTWSALPADMTVANQYAGYGVSLDNTSTPTTATLAPQAACYTYYGGATSATVRFAATDGNHTLWASSSDTKIRNYALIGTATLANYQWTMTTTDNVSYTLYNANAYSGAGRYLCVSDGKWGMYASGVSTFRFLPVASTTSHINMTVTEWDESAFTFETTDALPGDYDNVQAVYATTTDTFSVSQTGASSPYTLSIDGIDFSAHSGGTLIIQWRKGDEVKAFGTVVTPIFIKTTVTDLSDYDAESLAAMDLHISGTLNISTNTTVHNVTIASGGSLNITGSTTFHLNKLALEGGWNTAKTAYNVPRIYIASTAALQTTVSTVNYDISINKSNYYPLAVPFRVKVSDIDYAETRLASFSTYKTHYIIKEYDGALRAENGATDACWKVVEEKDAENADVYLEPGRGYIITAVPVGGKAVIRIPLSIANAWTSAGEKATIDEVYYKNVVAVGAYTGAATAGDGISGTRHKGWNLLGVPYMSCFTGSNDLYGTATLLNGKIVITGGESVYGYSEGSQDVPYVSVPVHDFSEYVQTPVAEAQLLPGWCFFVQVGTAGNLTFLTSKQDDDSNMPIYAPQRQDAAMPINRFALKLTGANHSDKTTVIVSDRYSTDYEIGADLEKLFGNSYTLATYTLSQGQPMAFNAMPESSAEQLIPVGCRTPEQGVYTFALEQNDGLEHFEQIDLIDYETGQLTNLLTDSYSFTALRTQTDERFAINAVISTHNTPTDIIPPTDSGGVRIEKRIIDDKLYIFTPSAVYDATGKRVFDINGKEGAK